jgi:hypothetical protein
MVGSDMLRITAQRGGWASCEQAKPRAASPIPTAAQPPEPASISSPFWAERRACDWPRSQPSKAARITNAPPWRQPTCQSVQDLTHRDSQLLRVTLVRAT